MDSRTKGPVVQSLKISFVVNLMKLLNKELSCQWFKTPLHLFGITVIVHYDNFPITGMSDYIP